MCYELDLVQYIDKPSLQFLWALWQRFRPSPSVQGKKILDYCWCRTEFVWRQSLICLVGVKTGPKVVLGMIHVNSQLAWKHLRAPTHHVCFWGCEKGYVSMKSSGNTMNWAVFGEHLTFLQCICNRQKQVSFVSSKQLHLIGEIEDPPKAKCISFFQSENIFYLNL